MGNVVLNQINQREGTMHSTQTRSGLSCTSISTEYSLFYIWSIKKSSVVLRFEIFVVGFSLATCWYFWSCSLRNYFICFHLLWSVNKTFSGKFSSWKAQLSSIHWIEGFIFVKAFFYSDISPCNANNQIPKKFRSNS